MTIDVNSLAANLLRSRARYSCFDFTLCSTISLPEMTEAPTNDAGSDVVEIRLGALPRDLSDVPESANGLKVDGSDVLLSIVGTARYLIRAGREIVVEPVEGYSLRNLRLFLLGSALGILCHQRGLQLLHANAIVAEGDAFAFAGKSGAGKSTLAAYFHRSGYDVLCDDVCGVSFDPEGQPVAWPGLPRLKLWEPAARRFDYDPSALEVAIEGLGKYHVPLERRALTQPIPLRRLYILSQAPPGAPSAVTQLRGVQAIKAIYDHTYRGFYLSAMGLTQRHFRQSAALLEKIQVYSASRVWGYDVFDRECAALEHHLSEDIWQRPA